jgi:tripartite-type tricarboxylate transporter receptor subunit TctC
MLRSAMRLIVFAAVMLQMMAAAGAQTFPSRPITVIVAQPAGSAVDVITRLYTDSVSKALGQTIVIDNRPGGGGIIGAQNLKAAAPDGHTLLVIANGPLTIAPWMRSLPYNVSKDFAPVSVLFGFSQFLAVSAESPVNSVGELIAFAKKKPGGLSYATLGIGSITHFLCSWVAKESGTEMSHVPYTNTSQYLFDLAANRVDFTFSSFQSTNSLEQEKKIKYLVTTAPMRSPLRPNVPTTAEAGVPDLNLSVWFSLLAPAGTPPAIIQRLNEQFVNVSKGPHISQRLAKEGVDGRVTSPADARTLIASEGERMRGLVKQFGIKAN